MFNPEKLLGGLLRSGMGKRKRSGLLNEGVAMGLLGVAMEAFEHFTNRDKPPQSPPLSGTSAGAGFSPPPAPGAAYPGPTPPAGIPSPPSSVSGGPPPPPPVARAGQTVPDDQSEAILLIRAMIAAANADNVIDEQERANILDKLQSVGLSSEEHAFIVDELNAPKSMDAIAGQASTEEMARKMYMASLMVIEVDTDAERRYLQTLAQQLNLNDAIRNDIHRQMGIDVF